ncbi:MAG TPA: ABC transporter permease [Terriglobia bacterium]
MNWIKQLLSRRRLYSDLSEEIQEHLEEKIDELVARGMSREDATHAARREFGNVTLLEERGREVWQWPSLESFLTDIRYGLRQLRRNPGFTAVAVLTLALGIGANTAMFTVIDSVLIRPLPFRDAERMVEMETRYGSNVSGVAWRDYPLIRDQCQSLENVAAYNPGSAVILAGGGAHTVAAVTVTANLFDLLSVRPALGRAFLDADSRPGARPVAILSARAWREYVAADPHVLGREIRLLGLSYTVVGVMPDNLPFPFGEPNSGSAIWLPFQAVPEMATNASLQASLTVGKLKPGVQLRSAQVELAVVSNTIAAKDGYRAGHLRFVLRPLTEVIAEGARPALLVLAAALMLVLLIASLNVANLQLARHLARRQELAVRAALGAGRSRLLRQLMAEGAVLAIAGTVAGLGFAWAALAAVHRLPPNFIPRADEIQLRLPVFAMLAIFAAVTTILSSLAPAVLATRTPLEEVLREGSGGSTAGKKRARLSEWLVAGEVALSAILLVSAGLLFHTLYNLEHIRFGFDLDQVTTFTATPANAMGDVQALATQKPFSNPPTESIVNRVYQPIADRLRQLPGVVDVAFSAWAPFDHNTMWVNYRSPKHPEVGPRGVMSQICLVSSGYAAAMGMPIVAGRMIADSDTAANTSVAVVNQTFARLAFRGENPVGQQIIDGTPAKHVYTIVGVLGDARQHDLTHTPDPEVLLAYQQFPTTWRLYSFIAASGTNYIIRTRGDVHLTAAIRQIFRQSAPDFALDHFRTMRAALDEVTFNQRLGLYLTASFAGVAILMVLTGLYGVLSQLVGQRRREIGIRMALGASRASIQAMILRRASLVTIVGLVAGLAASLAAGRLLRAFLFGVKPIDGLTYFAVAIVLLAVSIAAASIPARNAARTDFRTALQ